jgi:predicted HAD superfamily phosphohydrolase YqeG
MAFLTPDFCVDSFANLPTGALREEYGVRGLGLDIDGSLTGHDDMIVPAPHIKKIQEVNEDGIGMVILTNADDDARLARVGTLIDYVRQETDLELPVITSRAIGRAKPHPAMFYAAAAALGLETGDMAHFGDQLPKDILGAKLARYCATVLCAAYGKGGDPRVEYLQRPLESLVRPFLGLPRQTADFVKAQLPTGEHEGLPHGYSGGYREAKRACFAGAIGAAAAGSVQIATGKVKSGLSSEVLAAGLVGAAAGLRRHEQAEKTLEGLSALVQRSNGNGRP